MTGLIIAACVLVALVVLFFVLGYIKAPPDTAFIISGLGKRRILIGKAGWRMPFFTRLDKLCLGVMQVDVKTSEAVPTNEFINVSVDGVANIKISSDPELLKRAAEALLGKNRQEMVTLVTQVLEGNMREIVGSVGLKEMVQDRQGVAKKITENVVPDMEKLGIEVVNFNIQNFKDGAGTIENMGIDNVEQIRKNAQIAKANAQRDIAIATANAQQEANAVKVEAEKKIAEQDAALAVQQAEMKVKADTKRAEADAAYSIQQENQRKTIEIAKTNADIARREKEAELAEKEIALKERQLDAEIKKQADALKYKSEKQAEADLIKRQKEADAKAYEAIIKHEPIEGPKLPEGFNVLVKELQGLGLDIKMLTELGKEFNLSDLNSDTIETFAEATKGREEIKDIALEFDDEENKNVVEDFEEDEDFDGIFDETSLFDDFDDEN